MGNPERNFRFAEFPFQESSLKPTRPIKKRKLPADDDTSFETFKGYRYARKMSTLSKERENSRMKSETLAQYHLRPESKFDNGNYLDRGITERKHIKETGIINIGKETNKREEEFYLGVEEEPEITYGMSNKQLELYIDAIREKCKMFSQRKLACASGLSLKNISRVVQEKLTPTRKALLCICRGLMLLKTIPGQQNEG